MPKNAEDVREKLQPEARANEFNILSLLWLGSSSEMIGLQCVSQDAKVNQTSSFGGRFLYVRTASEQDLISP